MIVLKMQYPGFFLLIIIMGGIYGGIFTPTEAAAVAAVYAVLVSLFIYKDITINDLPQSICRCIKNNGNDNVHYRKCNFVCSRS